MYKHAIILICLCMSLSAFGQKIPRLPEKNLNFIIVNDMGANKPELQKPVADVMTRIAETRNVDLIIVAGDPIHGEGVQSADDKEWERKFERVYSAEALKKMPWKPICGNHEYRGNPQAVVDFSKKDPRWQMPSLYYSFHEGFPNSSKECLFAMLNTSIMVRVEKSKDPEQTLKDIDKERAWLDSLLTADHSHWKFVIGHHPIYADTQKLKTDLKEMQERVGDRIEEAGVDFYIGGHIHNFQYIKPEGKNVNYIINASASVNRDVDSTDGTVWCGDGPGLSLFSVSKNKVKFYFIDSEGNILYSNTIKK